MRIAALYDIHANLPALDAVLREVRQARVDQVVIGGDELPGPMPCETLEQLFDIGLPTMLIRGNGVREVMARQSRVETDWYRSAPEPWREPVVGVRGFMSSSVAMSPIGDRKEGRRPATFRWVAER